MRYKKSVYNINLIKLIIIVFFFKKIQECSKKIRMMHKDDSKQIKYLPLLNQFFFLIVEYLIHFKTPTSFLIYFKNCFGEK